MKPVLYLPNGMEKGTGNDNLSEIFCMQSHGYTVLNKKISLSLNVDKQPWAHG